VENNWTLDQQFVVDQIQSVFQMDALQSTHPMTSTVNTPAEASAIFDSISYNKGGSVIRMMEHLIGSEIFKLALQDYLKRK
jgi:aminopeptidase N